MRYKASKPDAFVMERKEKENRSFFLMKQLQDFACFILLGLKFVAVLENSL